LKEVRSEAVDRLLEALAPALSAELERAVEETRQSLETEFESRLQASMRHAEESVRVAVETDQQQAIQRAVEETRVAARSQITNELQTEFDRRLQELNSERDRLQQEGDEWRVFAEAQRQLTDATSQTEILARWLNFAEPFAQSISLYIAKGDALALWKTRGSGVFQQSISRQATDPESYFKPIVVRGKTVAAVCALPPYRAEELEFLATTLERAIELFGFRLRNKQ
jgi:hypothetical protein